MRFFEYPRQKAAMEKAFRTAHSRDGTVGAAVERILAAVRRDGDKAVARYSRLFDKTPLSPKRFRVEASVCRRAWESLPKPLAEALEFAAANIREFHERQMRRGFVMRKGGALLEQRVRPLRRVGVYVPGGRASYPSTVLMNVIPAQVAGVKEIVIVTPPARGSEARSVPLAAAHLLGLGGSVLRVGGAHAVAALAYGTAMIPPVDKVVGPGNAYVATAKRLLYGTIDIDSIAGESEVLIIADETADPRFVAADLIAQAEHTGAETVTVVGIGKAYDFGGVKKELVRQMRTAPRADSVRSSLRRGGFFVRVRTREEAVEVANLKAPEHMEILTRKPEELADAVWNVGAVFIGPWTPEPIGDYVAGPNHVLPTGGTARFFSPLGVDSFLKSSNVCRYDEASFRRAAPHVIELARSEGLFGHAASVEIRFENPPAKKSAAKGKARPKRG